MKFDRKRTGSLCCSAVAVSAIVLMCSTGPLQTSGGSGSETPNSVTIVSERSSLYGKAASNIDVGVYSSNYLPLNDSGIDARISSDAAGNFEFTALDSAHYNVIVTNPSNKKVVCIREVAVCSDCGPDTFVSELSSGATVSGTITDTSGMPFPQLGVYLGGLPFFAITDSAGKFLLSDVPAGDFRLLTANVVRPRPGRAKPDTLLVDTAITAQSGKFIEMGELRINLL